MAEQVTMQADPKDVQENKGITFLSYIGILALIPLLTKKESRFAQFHAKQGLVLLICEVITSVIFVIPYLGWLVGLVANITWLVLIITGLMNVGAGRMKELPIVGQYAKKINL